MKTTSTYKKQLFLLGAFLTPVVAAALFLWSLKLTEQLDYARATHKSQHSAVVGFITRDIDDLQTQLQNSLRGQNFLPGDFKFSATSAGLQATHSTLPSQPLKIALEGALAFSKPLNSSKALDFALITKENEVLSFSKNSKKLAYGIIGDNTLLKASTEAPVAFSGFDRSQMAPLTGRRLIDRPATSLFKSHIAGSNLILYSTQNIRPIWTAAFQSLALLLLSSLCAFSLGAIALWSQRSRQAKTQAWVTNFMESLRFGKIEGDLDGSDSENEVIVQIKESLKRGSALRKFMESEWVDNARSTVSWTFFKRLITHWSEGLSNNESEAPARWYLSVLRLKKAEHFEQFANAFTKTFGKENVFIFQANETESYVATRDASVARFTYNIRSTLKKCAESEDFASHDFALECFHISGQRGGEALNILNRVSKSCATLFNSLQVTLDERCVNIRNESSDALLVQMSLSEILNSPFYNVVTREPAQAETKLGFPKRNPVARDSSEAALPAPEKKRPRLPPPPTLRSKNLRQQARSLEPASPKAGRGFVRIVDALGNADWIEISTSGSSQNSSLISSPPKRRPNSAKNAS